MSHIFRSSSALRCHQEKQTWQELPSKRFAREEGGERVGQPMAAEAEGINPDITTEVTEEVKEITMEVKEEAIEAPSRLREQFRRLEAMWGRAAVQFYQAPKL